MPAIPGGGYLFAVDLVGGELADLQEGRAGVEQAVDAFARRQLATRVVARLGLLAAAFVQAGEQEAQVGDLLGGMAALLAAELRSGY